MNVWMNKNTGGLILATPQWEPIKINFDEKFYLDLAPEFKALVGTKRICHGVLLQVGWMLQNEHDVWFGVSMNTKESFEDLGEL